MGLATPPPNLSQIQPGMGTAGNRSIFASRLTYKYISAGDQTLKPQQQIQNWSGKTCYANPPWGLLLKTLSEVSHQQANVIVVAPVWKGQSWFPVLQSLLFNFPRLILPSETGAENISLGKEQRIVDLFTSFFSYSYE